MNGVDFPVAKVLDGIDAAVEAGLGPVKINVVLKRGENDDGILDARRAGRATPATSCGSSSTWTSARRTAGGSTRSSRRRRSSRRSGASGRSSRRRRATRGEVAERWRYLDGARRDRRHRLGDAAVLRRLHPGPHLGRGQALHVPLQRDRPRPARAAAGGRRPMRSSADAGRGDLGAAATTATPSGARRPRSGSRRSRCSPSAAEPSGPRRRPAAIGRGCPRPVHSGA